MSSESIPHVLHQTWKSRQLPERWAPLRRSWLERHPGWEHRLWTDDDNRRLIAESYPWFLPTYDAFPRQIQRVDAAKYFTLYHHGGVYADLDTECLRPIEPLLEGHDLVLGRTPDGVIEGAFLAGLAGHPFWKTTFREMERPPRTARFFHHVPGFDATHVLFSTGPRMLRRALRRYLAACAAAGADPNLEILEPRYLSSRSWLARNERFESGDEYLRHHYGHSWLWPSERRIVALFTRRRLLFAALVLAAIGVAVVGVAVVGIAAVGLAAVF